jgi:hypothetical protein
VVGRKALNFETVVRLHASEPNRVGVGEWFSHRSAKPNYVGSNPTADSRAGLAQTVEQLFCKQHVVGATPTTGSKCQSSSAGEQPPYKRKVVGSIQTSGTRAGQSSRGLGCSSPKRKTRVQILVDLP